MATLHINLGLLVNPRLNAVCGLQCFDTVGWAAGRASDL